MFRLTTEISKQCFPITIDLDNPVFKASLKRLLKINAGIEAAKAQGGVTGRVKQAGLAAAAGFTFLRLFMMPVKENALPASSRLQPAW